MSKLRVYLAGEGKTELGSWANEAPYREPHQLGTIEALVRKIKADGWRVADATTWAQIRKYKSGDKRKAETRNVLGLALRAKENHCDVVVFTRDEDGDHERASQIKSGIQEAATLFPGVKVAGGVAKPCIEGWALALEGQRGTESLSSHEAKEVFGKLARGGVSSFVDALPDLRSNLAADADALKQWLTHVEQVLC